MYKRNENKNVRKAVIGIAGSVVTLATVKVVKELYPFAVAKKTESKMKKCYTSTSIDVDKLTGLIEKERDFISDKEMDQIVREQLSSYLDDIEMGVNSSESLDELNDAIEKYAFIKQMALIRN